MTTTAPETVEATDEALHDTLAKHLATRDVLLERKRLLTEALAEHEEARTRAYADGDAVEGMLVTDRAEETQRGLAATEQGLRLVEGLASEARAALDHRRNLDRLRVCDLERDETEGVLRERLAEAQALLSQAVACVTDAYALQRAHANLHGQGRNLAAALGEQRTAVVRDLVEDACQADNALATLLGIARRRGMLR